MMECLKLIKVYHSGIGYDVPCGRCAFCLQNKRSSWMFRIHHEMRAQDKPGYFLTLTYDEKHVKRVADGRLSLRFRDVQLFLKRLRKEKFYAKYICVGEYGGLTKRPHYHLLLWSDCSADKIIAFWKLGSVHFGRLSMASAMYTLKYIIQPKQRQVDGVERTRAQFSKGLGLGYLTAGVYDYHTLDYDEPVMFSRIDEKKVALPMYYKRKIFTKYQMKVQGNEMKIECSKKNRRRFRELRSQGVRNIRNYIQALRCEQAKRIILKTKFNQVL